MKDLVLQHVLAVPLANEERRSQSHQRDVVVQGILRLRRNGDLRHEPANAVVVPRKRNLARPFDNANKTLIRDDHEPRIVTAEEGRDAISEPRSGPLRMTRPDKRSVSAAEVIGRHHCDPLPERGQIVLFCVDLREPQQVITSGIELTVGHRGFGSCGIRAARPIENAGSGFN